jgi:hypothetical protein
MVFAATSSSAVVSPTAHASLVLSIVALVVSILLPIILTIWLQPKAALRLSNRQRRDQRREEAADAVLRLLRKAPGWNLPTGWDADSADKQRTWDSERSRLLDDYREFLRDLEAEVRLLEDQPAESAYLDMASAYEMWRDEWPANGSERSLGDQGYLNYQFNTKWIPGANTLRERCVQIVRPDTVKLRPPRRRLSIQLERPTEPPRLP